MGSAFPGTVVGLGGRDLQDGSQSGYQRVLDRDTLYTAAFRAMLHECSVKFRSVENEPASDAPVQRRDRLGGILNHCHRRAA